MSEATDKLLNKMLGLDIEPVWSEFDHGWKLGEEDRKKENLARMNYACGKSESVRAGYVSAQRGSEIYYGDIWMSFDAWSKERSRK
jgi:hypothetical protein